MFGKLALRNVRRSARAGNGKVFAGGKSSCSKA